MDSSTTKIIAVVVVAVVVIAAIAYVFMGSSSDSDDYSGAALPVYGNANEDETIDSDDIDVINKIIDGEDGYTLAAYPYADANYDGSVTSADITLVNQIINGETTTIYHLNYANDGGTNVTTSVVSSKWPANGIITSYNSCMFIAAILGCQESVVGATAVGSVWGDYYDYTLYSTIKENAMSVDDSDLESVANCMEETGTYTFFSSGYTSYDITNEEDIEELGCDVIRLCESVPLIEPTIASILLAGFFLQVEDTAQEVAAFFSDVWDSTLEIAASIDDDDKVLFAVEMASETNQHVYKCELAGGSFAFADCGQDPGSYESYTFGDWVYNYQVDVMIFVVWSNCYNGTFFGDHDLDAEYIISSYSKYSNMECYLNGDVKIVYGDFPTAIDPLIRGYAMYPDLYEDLYNESINTLLGFLGEEWQDAGLQFVYSLEELLNY